MYGNRFAYTTTISEMRQAYVCESENFIYGFKESLDAQWHTK